MTAPPLDRLVVLRHAYAGVKVTLDAEDVVRPLDQRGIEAARRLVPVLRARATVTALVSSPYVRCLQTLEPLACALGLDVVTVDGLRPDADIGDILAVLAMAPPGAVVCTHGEVIRRAFGDDADCEKGDFWIVERAGAELRPVELVSTRVGSAV